MTELSVTRTVERVELNANAVLKVAWRLYKRLFARSVVMALLVFGGVRFFDALIRTGRTGGLLLLSTLVLTLAGVSLLQGGLVEIVRGLHVDGDDDPSVMEALGRAAGRTWKLVRVALLSALGIGVGLVLLVVPGLVLATRWAVAVPVAMIEGGSARDALRRSRTIVAGNGWNVFKILFAVGALSAFVSIPFTLVARGAGPYGWWVASTLGSALTAPYAAHALTVVYYALVQPERPVVLAPGNRWESVWDEQRSGSIWDE